MGPADRRYKTLITARPSYETAVLALRLGMDDYLPKPFDLKALRAAVARLTAPRDREGERRWQAEQLARARPRLAEAERVWASLTEREREVLRLLARGWTNARIAQELAVTERTVRFHLENLFARLEVDNRVAAVVKANRLGWLAVSE